jgi:hypothetical protein
MFGHAALGILGGFGAIIATGAVIALIDVVRASRRLARDSAYLRAFGEEAPGEHESSSSTYCEGPVMHGAASSRQSVVIARVLADEAIAELTRP